jgi:hypothetical protein
MDETPNVSDQRLGLITGSKDCFRANVQCLADLTGFAISVSGGRKSFSAWRVKLPINVQKLEVPWTDI